MLDLWELNLGLNVRLLLSIDLLKNEVLSVLGLMTVLNDVGCWGSK